MVLRQSPWKPTSRMELCRVYARNDRVGVGRPYPKYHRRYAVWDRTMSTEHHLYHYVDASARLLRAARDAGGLYTRRAIP